MNLSQSGLTQNRLHKSHTNIGLFELLNQIIPQQSSLNLINGLINVVSNGFQASPNQEGTSDIRLTPEASKNVSGLTNLQVQTSIVLN